jgi:predicted branched-subunit amino acid permease
MFRLYRSVRRVAPGDLGWTDRVALAGATFAFGLTVSAVMIDIGTPGPVVMLAAFAAFSGSGELAFAAVIQSGGSMVPALASALLVSARFGLLAMSIAQRWAMSVWEKLAAMVISGEPAVAAAISAPDAPAARRRYWQFAIPMCTGWLIGSAAGIALGNVIGDTSRIGLDAVFPAVLVSTVIGAMRSRDTAVAAVGGAVIAVILTPIAPAGLPFLLATAAALIAVRVTPGPWKQRRIAIEGEAK